HRPPASAIPSDPASICSYSTLIASLTAARQLVKAAAALGPGPERPEGRASRLLPQEDFLLGAAHARRGLDQIPDEAIYVDALGFTLEIQDESVPQRGQRHRPKILCAHVVAAFGERAHLGAEHERLRPPRARAVADEPARRLRGLFPLRVCRK